MNYTVLTYVPKPPFPPPPGQDRSVGVRELGCVKCIHRFDKTTLCIEHHRLRVLWARTETIPEVDDNITETIPDEADGALLEKLPPIHPEHVEVPA